MIVICHEMKCFIEYVLYCSAGVGRTGTLITIDRVLDQIEKEKVVDIAGVIQHLRHQRMKMVQNAVCILWYQYIVIAPYYIILLL